MTDRANSRSTFSSVSAVLRQQAILSRGLYTEGFSMGWNDVMAGKPFDQEMMDRGPSLNRKRYKGAPAVDTWTPHEWTRFQQGYESGRDLGQAYRMKGVVIAEVYDVNQARLPKSIELCMLHPANGAARTFRRIGLASSDEYSRSKARRSIGCLVDVIPEDADDSVRAY